MPLYGFQHGFLNQLLMSEDEQRDYTQLLDDVEITKNVYEAEKKEVRQLAKQLAAAKKRRCLFYRDYVDAKRKTRRMEYKFARRQKNAEKKRVEAFQQIVAAVPLPLNAAVA